MIRGLLMSIYLLSLNDLCYCQNKNQVETKITNSISDSLLVPFRKNGKWGYAKLFTKEIIIPAKYDYPARFRNGIAAIPDMGNKAGAINTRGEVVIPFIYDYVFTALQDDALVVGIDKRFFLLSLKGKVLTKSYKAIYCLVLK